MNRERTEAPPPPAITLAEAEQRLRRLSGVSQIALAPRHGSPTDVTVFADQAPQPGNRQLDFGLFYFSDGDDPSGQDNYRLYLDGAKVADELGFAAIWTPERHFTAVGAASPNPSVLSAAVAALTHRISLRSGSVVLPLHHPVRVVEEWAIVDRLSNGRVELSFASGWVPDDFIFAPQAYKDRSAVTIDLIDEIRALWRGEARTFTNGVGLPTEIRVRPRPLQAELPVWVTAASNPRTFEEAGRIGANVLTATLKLSLAQVSEYVELYRHARGQAGHDPESGRVAVMLHTYVTDRADAAREEAAAHLHSYFRAQTALRQAVAVDMGRNLAGTQRYMDRIIEHSVKLYLEEKSLIGSPESCQPMIERLKAIGVDEVACLIDFGIPAENVLSALPTLNRLRRSASDLAERWKRLGDAYLPAGLRIVAVRPFAERHLGDRV